ncbi:energy transducer TonB [bacterium]|nr:energy transducer TonB [bacterium]
MRFLTLALTCFWFSCFAQQDSLYSDYDTMPQYEEGLHALYIFFSENIAYPEEAVSDSVEGTVRLCFNIDTNGNVEFKQFVSDRIGSGLEEEALRVLMLTDGHWLPATKDGKAVIGSLSLPIRFQLE